MLNSVPFDVSVIGGGLAGLTFAIQCAQAGCRVILFEKNKYPFHKVCGEYISNESRPFLERLGVPVAELQLPNIDTLQLSANSGRQYEFPLPRGGFGVSRFLLDNLLYEIALQKGVLVCAGTTVHDVQFLDEQFIIRSSSGEFTSRLSVGSFGKRSNLDVKWKRSFLGQKSASLTNFIGVKYHVDYPHESNVIALHNFPNGYCGISQIEENKSCLCYLTTAENLRNHQNDIGRMERENLSSNPRLKQIFTEARFLYTQPLVISQVNFRKKTQVEGHMLMLGDSAGLITPLCGNGMTMAVHSAQLAFQCVRSYLKNECNREQMEHRYVQQWQAIFSKRLLTGRVVQQLMGAGRFTGLFLNTMKRFPHLAQAVIKSTGSDSF